MQGVISVYTTDPGRMAIFLAKLSQTSRHESIKLFLHQGFKMKVDFMLRTLQRGETPFKLECVTVRPNRVKSNLKNRNSHLLVTNRNARWKNI